MNVTLMMNWFKKDREQEKDLVVNGIVDRIVNNIIKLNHSEQTEIINRVTLRLMERKKERRAELIKEARELQESITEIKIYPSN